MSYSELLSKFSEISFQDMLPKESLKRVFYGDLVYTLRSVKGAMNFVSSGSKIVNRLRRRKYDPVTIERTIGLVLGLGPSTSLCISFLEHYTLTNKAVGTYDGTCTKLLGGNKALILVPLFVIRDSFSPWT